MDVQTIMRTLNVISQSLVSVINRVDIKNVLTELEKNVINIQPDIIVLSYCSRYVLSELNNKEWCKYYHMSVTGNSSLPRTHIVLSRYPILRSESFGSPLVHIVETKIPFNDIPIRYEYEDVAVQMVDMDTITVIVTSDSEQSSEQHISNVSNIVAKICAQPHTVLLVGTSGKGPLRSNSGIQWVDADDSSQSSGQSTLCSTMCYTSEAWQLRECTERVNNYSFELVCLE
jgi:hypothetical protein